MVCCPDVKEPGNYNKTLRTNLRDITVDLTSSKIGGGLSGRVLKLLMGIKINANTVL